MEIIETKYKSAAIRIQLSGQSKEETAEKLKQATEIFLKKVMASNAEKGKYERVANF